MKTKLTKLDWWDVVHILRPELTWAEFCALYRDFRRAMRAASRTLQH